MNTSNLSRGQMLVGGGAVLLIIALFLSWISGFGGSASAFDAFSAMDIIMLLVAIAALVWVALPIVNASVAVPAYAGWIVAMLAVALIGFVGGYCIEQPDAGIGAWLALLAVIVMTWGAFEASSGPAATTRTGSTVSSTSPPPPPPTTPAV